MASAHPDIRTVLTAFKCWDGIRGYVDGLSEADGYLYVFANSRNNYKDMKHARLMRTRPEGSPIRNRGEAGTARNSPSPLPTRIWRL